MGRSSARADAREATNDHDPQAVVLQIACFNGTGHIIVTPTAVRLESLGMFGKKTSMIGRNAITGLRKHKKTLALLGTYPAYEVWIYGMGGQKLYAWGCYGRDVDRLARVLGYR